MAATPKRKHSTQRQGKRRSQLVLKETATIKCKDCGKPKRPHYSCENCTKQSS